MGDNMKFTKKELKEIEKVFDVKVTEIIRGMSKDIDKLYQIDPDNEKIHDIVADIIDSYNAYREISAKAEVMQDEMS